MASVLWRRNKQVTVYYWDNKAQKLVPLPRDQTRHLDGKPKDFVHKWVADWEKAHGKLVSRVNRSTLKDDDILALLWKQYQGHQAKRKNRRERTAEKETDILHGHLVPFFIERHQKKDPADWHALIPAFHDYLYEQKFADATVQKTLWTLERFGKYLVFKQHITFPFVVLPPARKAVKVTPLKTRKTPEEVLKYVRTHTHKHDIDFNLAILLGYFAALGPGEVFALEREDLVTGAEAEGESKTLEGLRAHNLGSKLAVVISKTLPQEGPPVPFTKNDFRLGVASIWHPEAAKLIASIVREKPEGRLFPFSMGWLARAWREQVRDKLGCTPHDLRRASCLYLGRTLRIEPTLLQEHMRHASLETTQLYMREPAVPEKKSKKRVQDFDDVA